MEDWFWNGMIAVLIIAIVAVIAGNILGHIKRRDSIALTPDEDEEC